MKAFLETVSAVQEGADFLGCRALDLTYAKANPPLSEGFLLKPMINIRKAQMLDHILSSSVSWLN